MKSPRWAVLLFCFVVLVLVYPMDARSEDVGVVDGGFELDSPLGPPTHGWIRNDSIDGMVVTANVHSGNRALQFVSQNTAEYYQAIDVSSHSNETITITGWMYINGYTPGMIQSAMASSSECSIDEAARTTVGTTDDIPSSSYGAWVPFTSTTTVTAQYLCIFLQGASTQGNTLYMDDIGATTQDLTTVRLRGLRANGAKLWLAVVTALAAASSSIGGIIPSAKWRHR